VKEIGWMSLAGAAAMGVLDAALSSGKVLPKVRDLDLWTDAVVIGADIIAEPYLGTAGAGFMDGAGAAALALGINKLAKWHLVPAITGTTASGSSNGTTATPTVVSSGSSTQSNSSTITALPTSAATTSGYMLSSDVPSSVAG